MHFWTDRTNLYSQYIKKYVIIMAFPVAGLHNDSTYQVYKLKSAVF